MAGGGNTSIMDLMTGHAAPSMKDIANRSMSLMGPNKDRSFVSSQKSFFSKKPNQIRTGANNNNVLDDFSSGSEGGEIKKVEAFSDGDDSDSEDCIVESTDTKVKSTGFFHKLRLRDLMKEKGHKKVEVFREGESDEYNSEVDGEVEIDENAINFDILSVRFSSSKVH